MDVELNADQSAALRKALKTYLSDLRMEIVDTDNPGYRRELRDERASLESVVDRLDEAAKNAANAATSGEAGAGEVTVRWVSVWSVDE